jgi:hypothetical protein
MQRETFLASAVSCLFCAYFRALRVMGTTPRFGIAFKEPRASYAAHFRVAISYSCEAPREQRWKCLKCGGGGRKFSKEARATRLLVKHVEEAGGGLCSVSLSHRGTPCPGAAPVSLGEGWWFNEIVSPYA